MRQLTKNSPKFSLESQQEEKFVPLAARIRPQDFDEFVGLPEAQINLAQAVTYLATAPKSNASYSALLAAKEDVEKTLNEPVPLHLRNAPTPLAKKLGYGKNYQYPHKFPGYYVKENYFPKKLTGRKYYYPTDQGEEAKIAVKLAKLRGKSQKIT